MSKTPKPLSPGEEALALHLRAHHISFEREYSISDKTNHRFDFFIAPALLIEVQGGTWKNGAHSRHAGVERDCRKGNLAVFLGYKLLRYTTEMVTAGDAINDVLALLRTS